MRHIRKTDEWSAYLLVLTVSKPIYGVFNWPQVNGAAQAINS